MAIKFNSVYLNLDKSYSGIDIATWVSGTNYSQNDIVYYSDGKYYKKNTSGTLTSTTNPASDTTNWTTNNVILSSDEISIFYDDIDAEDYVPGENKDGYIIIQLDAVNNFFGSDYAYLQLFAWTGSEVSERNSWLSLLSNYKILAGETHKYIIGQKMHIKYPYTIRARFDVDLNGEYDNAVDIDYLNSSSETRYGSIITSYLDLDYTEPV